MKPKRKAYGKILVLPILLLLITLTLTQSVQARLMNKKLSGEMIDAGDVAMYTISPDGRYVVFVGDAHDDEVLEIFSVPTVGGPRVTLFTAPDADITVSPKITPDSSHVVFIVGGSERIYNFYAVPIAGGPIIELFTGGRCFHGIFEISQDSKHVFFIEEHTTPAYHQIIWRLPIDGGPPVRISPETCETCEYQLIPSPDSQYVVYSEYSGTPSKSLYVVDLDGNNQRMLAEWIVNFDITPDGNDVVFTKQLPTSHKINLYAVPISGGGPIQLNGDLVDGGQVMDFNMTPDSQYLVYRADESLDDQFLLYGAKIDGSDHWPLIDPTIPVPPTMDVVRFHIAPNGLGVVFTADPIIEGRYDLFSVPTLGGRPHHLNHELIDFEYISLEQITPNNLGVVYLAQIEPGLTELFAVSIIGTYHVKLNPTLPPGGSVRGFQIAPNSQGVVYIADQEMAHVNNVYAVSILGGVDPIQLNPPLTAGGAVVRFSITPDSKGVVYLADQAVNDQFELFLTYDYQMTYLPLITH